MVWEKETRDRWDRRKVEDTPGPWEGRSPGNVYDKDLTLGTGLSEDGWDNENCFYSEGVRVEETGVWSSQWTRGRTVTDE